MLQVTLSKPLSFFLYHLKRSENQGIFRVFRGQRKGPVVIRQKGEKTGVTKKQSRIIFQRTNISYPLIRTHTFAYKGKGVRNVNFSKHFAYFYIDNTKSFSSTSGNAILLGSFI